MGISKTLLYPFSLNTPYFNGYSWSIELAVKLNAKLQLFTTITPHDEGNTSLVYQSLLAAHGYYLNHFKHDHPRPNKTDCEHLILSGEPGSELVKYLKGNAVDILIIDPVFQSHLALNLKEAIRASGGAIILVDPPLPEAASYNSPTITEHFYNRLRHAEFYKISRNFFGSLGQDPTAYNYLRKFFQKNPG